MVPDPTEINSFESAEEIAALRRLAAGRLVLEVGTFHGFSAILMALSGAKQVHTVDWHRGGHELGEQDTLIDCWIHLERYGVRDRVVLHVGPSEVVLPLLRPGLFDLALVDGDHHQAVRDTELCIPLVRPGGLLVWHDKNDWQVPEAIERATALLGVLPQHVGGSLAAVQVP